MRAQKSTCQPPIDNFFALSLLLVRHPPDTNFIIFPFGVPAPLPTRQPLHPPSGRQATGGAGSGVQRHGSREVHEPTDRDAVAALAIDDAERAAGVGITSSPGWPSRAGPSCGLHSSPEFCYI